MLAFLPSRRTEVGLVLLALLVALVVGFFVPIGRALRRETVLATADIQRIATAVTRFYIDLRHFPVCSGEDCSSIVTAGPSQNNQLAFLAVGDWGGDLSRRYPRESASLVTRWDLATRDHPDAPQRNNAYHHLVANDPNADGIGDRRDYQQDGRLGWGGPYVTDFGFDPWGHTYIVSVGAMEPNGRPIAPRARGWILSAGPNGVLETAPDASIVVGDDIGMVLDGASLPGS